MKCKEKGVALITALLVVALATAAAVAMVSQQQVDIRRTGNILQVEQAFLYTSGIELWAARMLEQDAKENSIDTLNDDWATQLPLIPIEGGSVSGSIADLQGRFNLNSLLRDGKIDTAVLERFRRLLTLLNLDPAIADALADWLDNDGKTRFPNGAEDNEYLAKELPYRSANMPMSSTSELLYLPQVTDEVYKTLFPYVTALPANTPINVNTASDYVLMSLSRDIDKGVAAELIDARGSSGYVDVEAFTGQAALKGKILPVEDIAVASRYFLLRSQVTFGRISVDYQSMLYRSENKTSVVSRARGSL